MILERSSVPEGMTEPAGRVPTADERTDLMPRAVWNGAVIAESSDVEVVDGCCAPCPSPATPQTPEVFT